MARGPLPNPDHRRRNAPTIPTTNLPISGRTEPAPTVPSWVHLGKAGRAWWKWAWSTPQATAWGVKAGAEGIVARRASLEDDLRTLDNVIDDVHLDEIEADVANAIRRIAAMATGRLQVMREMREIDDRLGLSPKGLAALRWKIVADGEGKAAPTTAAASGTPYGHLTAVAGD